MTTTVPTSAEPIEEFEADFSWLGKQKMDTLEDLGIYINDATPKEYCISYRDKYGRDRERVICPVNAPIGTLEWYILKEMGKQVDLVDLTQHRSHDQIIQLLDTHSETWADIDSYDFPAATQKEAPFDSMQDAFDKIQTDPKKYLDYLWESNLPAAIPPLAANDNSITFTPTAPPWAAVKKVFIQEVIIKLFQNKQVYNKEIAQYLYNRVSLERRKERAQARQERMAARSGTNQLPWTSNVAWGTWANILTETNEELSVPQLYAACEQAQRKPNTWSTYSFDKKWFFVRYNGSQFPAVPTTTPANQAGKFHVQFQKKDWTTGVAVWDTIWEIVAAISTLSEKKEAKSDKSLTIDMGTEFDENKFIELCKTIGSATDKVGYYKFDGKQYSVRRNGPKFMAEYPGEDWHPGHRERTKPEDLAHDLTEHMHIHEHDHTLSKKSFLDLCAGLTKNYNENHKEKAKSTYELGGKKYPIWVERRNTGRKITSLLTRNPNPFNNIQFYAEVPDGHSTKIITSGSAEGLFNKIKKINETTGHEKPAEWAAKAESTEPKDVAHAEDHGHSHTKTEGTFYDRSVEKIFGHGLIGRAFIGTKNLIPTPIRKISGNAAAAGVRAGLVWGILYGGSIALGSAAMASAIVPAMGITFATSSTLRLIKWWRNRGKKDDSGWHGWH